MYHIVYGCENFIYGNVRIRRIELKQATATLSLSVIYVEHEEKKILYDDVLYSQIDKNVEGKHIALVAELTPEEFRSPKHKISSMRFQQDCRLKNLDPIEEMCRVGYRLFIHYVGKKDEYIVIAKNLTGY